LAGHPCRSTAELAAATALVAELRDCSGSALALQANVSSGGEVRAMFEELDEWGQQLDLDRPEAFADGTDRRWHSVQCLSRSLQSTLHNSITLCCSRNPI
jgi:hypothetical protein